MYEATEEFFEKSVEIIRARSGNNVAFSCSGHDQFMDRIILQFSAGAVHTKIAQTYTSEERFHFFAIRAWQWITPYLIRVKHLYPELSGEADLWLDDVPTFPGLVFSAGGGSNQAPIPDPLFLSSHGYADIRELVRSGTLLRWDARNPTVFWRGVTTGRRLAGQTSVMDLQRLKLCRIGQCSSNPGLYDFGITGIVQCNESERVEVQRSGFLKPHVAQEAFSSYRYAVDIDGNCNSWPGLFTKLLMGNTVLKVASPEGFYQWYYDRLDPWIHFVPVSADMSDLEEKTNWLIHNPEAAKRIALNGQKLALQITEQSEVVNTFSAVNGYLGQAGSSGSFDPVNLKTRLFTDPDNVFASQRLSDAAKRLESRSVHMRISALQKELDRLSSSDVVLLSGGENCAPGIFINRFSGQRFGHFFFDYLVSPLDAFLKLHDENFLSFLDILRLSVSNWEGQASVFEEKFGVFLHHEFYVKGSEKIDPVSHSRLIENADISLFYTQVKLKFEYLIEKWKTIIRCNCRKLIVFRLVDGRPMDLAKFHEIRGCLDGFGAKNVSIAVVYSVGEPELIARGFHFHIPSSESCRWGADQDWLSVIARLKLNFGLSSPA